MITDILNKSVGSDIESIERNESSDSVEAETTDVRPRIGKYRGRGAGDRLLPLPRPSLSCPSGKGVLRRSWRIQTQGGHGSLDQVICINL